jgi:TRAP-type transport system large permease protein
LIEVAVGFGVFFLLIFLGQEVFLAMASAVVALILVAKIGLDAMVVIPQTMTFGVESLELAAIPLFILSGELMNAGGITRRLVVFSRVLIGHIRGGLSMVAVMVNMLMAGVSGSAVADASSTGAVLIPAMKEDGYDVDYAAALIASAATVGPIIPPSIPMIVIAVVANVSVGKLFLGGAIPGIIMGLGLMFTCYVIARRHNYPKLPRATASEVLYAFRDAILALLMPLFILFGVVFGIATLTEIAGVAAAYAAIVGGLIFREIKLSQVMTLLGNAAVMSAVILITLTTAHTFAWFMTTSQVGVKLMSLVAPFVHEPIVLLLLINVFMLLVGCVFEPFPAIVIFVPIMITVVKSVGLDLTHFCVIVVFNLMLGLLTPPVGLNFFVTATIANRPPEAVIKKLWPFFLILLIVLVICTLIPQLVLWLPNTLMP